MKCLICGEKMVTITGLKKDICWLCAVKIWKKVNSMFQKKSTTGTVYFTAKWN